MMQTITHYGKLLFVIADVFAFGLHAAEPAKKPNIIFVLADGYADIGPFGQKIIHTPANR